MGGSGRAGVPGGSGDKRLLGQQQGAPAASSGAAGEGEKCPRCGSNNTKFCYYNNYNLAQPRHFCKACRRYWTLGGTLRNVPVGGSTRRATQLHQSKQHQQPSFAVATASYPTRRRSAPAHTAAASPSSSSSSSPPLNSLAFDASTSVAALSAACKTEASAVEENSGPLDAIRSFESLLMEPLPAGFLALGEPFLGGRDGFGLGLGLGGGGPAEMEEMGFGLGIKSGPAWPNFFGDDEGSMVAGHGSAALDCVGCLDAGREAWQVTGDGGDCFGWPELAMWTSTPEKGMH